MSFNGLRLNVYIGVRCNLYGNYGLLLALVSPLPSGGLCDKSRLQGTSGTARTTSDQRPMRLMMR